jgi:ribosomal protein L35
MPLTKGKTGKIRTKSAAKKRIRKMGGNKLAIEKPAHNHLLLQKSKRQKNKASKPIALTGGDLQRISKMFSSIKRKVKAKVVGEEVEAPKAKPAPKKPVAKKATPKAKTEKKPVAKKTEKKA